MAKKMDGGKVDFKVTASGLDKVNKDTKKAANTFNQFDKNARSADRAGKGVANMSSNVTKNFSKMSQGITGGLVPAYATLAAQLFALDALFRFFREAADFRVLQQGQELFAASTGRAMRTLSKDIQAATSAQITFKEASQSTAIGLSAGLSPTMLKELGEAARTVSVALGRDTTDSFNRLIRGVTKAEPELLDELGIILRLEEATTRYAASLGLNKNQLTTFQKSQAVANEVLRQAEERYGAINGMIGDDSVNQLNKLMVAFDEVMNRIRMAVAPIAEFFGTFLTENIESATAAIGVFAASISGGLIRGAMPVINYGKAAAVASSVAGSGDLQESAQMSKERIGRLSTPGQATEQDIKAYERAVNAKKSKMIQFEKFTRREHKKTVAIIKAQRQRMIADANTGFKAMKAGFVADLYEMEAEHGKVMGRMKFAGLMFGKMMSGIMSAIGFIGIAVMIFQMGKQLFNMFREVDERAERIRKKIDGQNQSLQSLTEEIGKTADFFERELFTSAEQRIKAIGGAFQSADFAARVREAREALNSLGAEDESVKEMLIRLRMLAQELSTFNPEFEVFAQQLKQTPQEALRNASSFTLMANSAVAAGQAVDSITRAQANYQKQFNKFEQAGKKIPFQDIIFALNELQKEQFKFADSQALVGKETEKANAQYKVTMSRLSSFKALYEASASRAMQFLKAQSAGLNSATALFGDKEDIQNALKVAKQIDVIMQQEEALLAKRIAVENMQAGLAKDIQLENLKMAEMQVEIEKDRLAMLLASQDKVLKAFRNATTAFAKELGTTFGKLFRGESVDFKEFGKTLSKTLTNAMGEALANRIMKISFRGTPLDPNVQRAKFKQEVEDMLMHQGTQMAENLGKAGEDVSINLYNGVDKGGVDAAESIYDAMRKAADYHAGKIINSQVDGLTAQIALDKILKKEADDAIIEAQKQNRPGSIEAELANRRAEIASAVASFTDPGMFTAGTRRFPPELMRQAREEQKGQVYLDSSKMEETLIFKTIKSLFPGRELRDMGIGSGPGDRRIQFITEMGQSFAKALKGGKTGDIATLSSASASFKELDGRVIQSLRDSGVPEIIAMLDFMGDLPAVIQKLEEAEENSADRLNLIDKNNKIIEENTKVSESLETRIKENTDKKGQIGTVVVGDDDDSGATTGGFKPKAGSGTTSTKTGASGPGVQTFQQMTSQLFPALTAGLDGSDSAVANFATGALQFSTVITQFGSLISQGLSLAGKQEEAADLMMEVAKIQMALAIAEMASKLGESIAAIKRYGGTLPGARYGAATGGIFDGPEAGYNVKMHGNEAVVPLGNDRSIPVKMSGSGGTNNVNVTVNVDQNGQSETLLTGDGARELGKTIAAIAQDTIAKEQRAGGLLSSI